LVAAARTSEHGVTLFLVQADAAGLSRKRLRLLDGRAAAQIEFDGVRVEQENVLGAVDGGGELLEAILDRARVGLAAEMLGVAEQAFELTIGYLKERVQFGRPIGSFQALQHRAAALLADLELARPSVGAALRALDADSAEAPELASLAKAKMGDVLHAITNEMIQIHGGIGMTDAHDAGLYLKRARVAEALFGAPAFHRERYGRLKGY
jgi:alkylation response protein AidB-like acyl-CoA dehydrogenase